MRKLILMAAIAVAGCGPEQETYEGDAHYAVSHPPATLEQLCRSARASRDLSIESDPKQAERWNEVLQDECGRMTADQLPSE